MNRGSNADPIFQRELGRDYPTIDRGEGIPHERVKEWVASWDTTGERPLPR